MSIIRVSELTSGNTIDDQSLFLLSQYTGGTDYNSQKITYSTIKTNLSDDGFISTGSTRYCGAFSSTQTQTTTGIAQPMTFTNQDIELGCSLSSSSEIMVSHSGTYNLQFSAQIEKTQGGTSEDVYIWFRVNGQDVPNSNTKLTLANNGIFVVASWNILLTLNVNDKVQIIWATTDTQIQLPYVASAYTTFGPSIPSVIATITQV
jgi:hypothetical protein